MQAQLQKDEEQKEEQKAANSELSDLVQESKANAEAWIVFQKRNEEFKKSEPGQKLDKKFFHLYTATGEKVEIKTVEEGIVRIANTMSKPEDNIPAPLQEQIMQG